MAEHFVIQSCDAVPLYLASQEFEMVGAWSTSMMTGNPQATMCIMNVALTSTQSIVQTMMVTLSKSGTRFQRACASTGNLKLCHSLMD